MLGRVSLPTRPLFSNQLPPSLAFPSAIVRSRTVGNLIPLASAARSRDRRGMSPRLKIGLAFRFGVGSRSSARSPVSRLQSRRVARTDRPAGIPVSRSSHCRRRGRAAGVQGGGFSPQRGAYADSTCRTLGRESPEGRGNGRRNGSWRQQTNDARDRRPLSGAGRAGRAGREICGNEKAGEIACLVPHMA